MLFNNPPIVPGWPLLETTPSRGVSVPLQRSGRYLYIVQDEFENAYHLFEQNKVYQYHNIFGSFKY